MKFEWDENKNNDNVDKHGFDFKDAHLMFDNMSLLVYEDKRKNYGETRYIGFGRINNRVLNIVFTKRNEILRIISLRKANLREVKAYEKQFKNKLGKD